MQILRPLKSRSISLLWALPVAAFAAVGGPMHDLFFLRLLQSEYTAREMSQVLRFTMMLSQGLTLVAFLVSPNLMKIISPELLVAYCGLLIFLFNAAAFVAYRNRQLSG